MEKILASGRWWDRITRVGMKKKPVKLTAKEQRRRLKPKGGGAHYFQGRDRQRLRYGLWKPENLTKGTVFVLPGRGEFIEKYYETIADLKDRGFAVVIFDWRGQGMSGRLIKNETKAHIDDFRLMVDDLADLIKLAGQKKLPRPWTVLAHSTGAHMFFRLLHDYPRLENKFEKAVICSPMLGLNLAPLTLKYLHWLIKRAKRKRRMKSFAPLQSNKAKLWKQRLGVSHLTSDPARLRDETWLIDRNPALGIGGVTYGWLEAVLKSIDLLKKSSLPEKLNLPLCFIVSGKEKVVDPQATADFIARMPRAICVTLKNARHEILKERDEIRVHFWKIFDSFV